jgi:hypothetical protein
MQRHSQNWNIPVPLHDEALGSPPPIAQLYRETQIALAALTRISRILEKVASTNLPED